MQFSKNCSSLLKWGELLKPDNISLDGFYPSWSQIEQEPKKLAEAKVIKIKKERLRIVFPKRFTDLKLTTQSKFNVY